MPAHREQEHVTPPALKHATMMLPFLAPMLYHRVLTEHEARSLTCVLAIFFSDKSGALCGRVFVYSG